MTNQHQVELIWQHKGEDYRKNLQPGKVERQYIVPNIMTPEDHLFTHTVEESGGEQIGAGGRLIRGDNLAVLQILLQEGYEEKIDLIYIDPPYLSSNKYVSRVQMGNKDESYDFERLVFVDKGRDELDTYLNDIYHSLLLMKELLSSQGSILVHLDWHVSHYVKVVMDEIFGAENFINEIVWCYGGGSSSKRHFRRKHDLIFWYGKGGNYIFNPIYRPYSKGTLERGLTRVKGNKYNLHREGALMQDWWTDINKILSPTAYENLKFPTQKPAALMERLILAASNPGSVVADFYLGSGTTMAVCEAQGRNWIGCDSSKLAVNTAIERLLRLKSRPFALEVIDDVYANPAASLDVVLHAHAYNNQYTRLDIEITGYRPREAWPGTFKNAIQLWEIDPCYQEGTFCSRVQIVRNKAVWDESLPLIASLLIPRRDSGAVAIKLYDVYGDSCMRVLAYG